MRWWRRHFQLAEGAVVLLLSLVFAWWLSFRGGAELVSIERTSDNIAVAAALVSLFGTLLGFGIAAITFLFGVVDKEPFKILRASKRYNDHWRIFKSSLLALSIATLLSVLCLFCFWVKVAPLTLMTVTLAAILWSTARLGRVVWAINHMINAEVRMGEASRANLEQR